MSTPVVSRSRDKEPLVILDRVPVTVLLLEGIHQTAINTFTQAGMRVATLPTALPETELIAIVLGQSEILANDGKPLGRVNVLGIRSKTTLMKSFFDAANKDLLAIGCFCIGTNQVDGAVANSYGIPVFNAPYANTRSVAELVICEVIALSRKLCDQSKDVHSGVWTKSAVGCYEVRGKTIGIVGYGHIGSQVGVLAEMLGLNVRFYDHVPKLPMGNNKGVGSLGELLAEADFVTLHVPETPETKNMITKVQLAMMKKGSYLLNLSRGTVVVIEDLVEALKSGHLSGGAIDVYPEEPEGNCKDFATPLQKLNNVILTPHVGGSTAEAQRNIGSEVAFALRKFIVSGGTTGSVNFPVVEPPQDIGNAHRLINIHKNEPGVLRDVNRIISDLGGNIRRQMLSTDETIGYLVIDIDQDVSLEVHAKLAIAPFTIHGRVVESLSAAIISPLSSQSPPLPSRVST